MGRVFPGIEVRIIAETEGLIGSIEEAEGLPAGPDRRDHRPRPSSSVTANTSSVARKHHGWRSRRRPVLAPDRVTSHTSTTRGFCGSAPEGPHRRDGRWKDTRLLRGDLREPSRRLLLRFVGIGPRPHQQPVIVVEPEPDSSPATRPPPRPRANCWSSAKRIRSQPPSTVPVPRIAPADTRHNVK